MDEKESGAGGGDSAGAGSRRAITPRKASMPTGAGEVRDYGLQLTPTSREPIWERRNRICPKSPKVPFEEPSRTIEAPGSAPGTTFAPRHGSRRGLIAFFRSRRQGRTRVLNYIVLPIAVLLALALIFVLFKFR
jgi:hypothetical protein